ncbi:MAG: hypothetical protein VZQ81_05390 [Succiniclasticum sp.]|jgi:DNA-binding transcriptional MerR regulator|nr:hypothetical protein [Succiniclasticum sp.]MEE3479440.1 hypothetical protein [Succiniclasticum sp.]
MDGKELQERYRVSDRVLQEYAEWKRGQGKRDGFSESDVPFLSLMLTLYDIGFNKEETARYLSLAAEHDQAGCLELLEQLRARHLRCLHRVQGRLERLDSLRSQMQKR